MVAGAVRILVLSGSTRPASLNRRLAGLAARALRALGAEATEISLADFPLPFVDEDGRAAPPEPAQRLNTLILAHQGLFIACPEYNAGYTPLLKNALDWASMCRTDGPGLAGKIVGLGGASTGPRGGYRALTQFRTVLELGFGALVIPEMASVPFAHKVLTEEGEIADQQADRFFKATIARLHREAARAAS
jgi:NAD(P)H-dependent FMN reductase